MTEVQKQTDESADVKPSAALKFVKGAAKKERKTDDDSNTVGLSHAETQNGNPKNAPATERTSKPKGRAKPKPETELGETKRKLYEPFSTRIRHDLKRRLKRLSHYREDSGHRVFKVQHFVEEALDEWLSRQQER